jgi:hypothetical protein
VREEIEKPYGIAVIHLPTMYLYVFHLFGERRFSLGKEDKLVVDESIGYVHRMK